MFNFGFVWRIILFSLSLSLIWNKQKSIYDLFGIWTMWSVLYFILMPVNMLLVLLVWTMRWWNYTCLSMLICIFIETGHFTCKKRLTTLFFSSLKTDFLEAEFKTQLKVKTEPAKTHNFPVMPKEEELSEEELEKLLEERYKPGSSFVTYAEDLYDSKRMIEGNVVIPSSRDPTIWKVKCMV